MSTSFTPIQEFHDTLIVRVKAFANDDMPVEEKFASLGDLKPASISDGMWSMLAKAYISKCMMHDYDAYDTMSKTVDDLEVAMSHVDADADARVYLPFSTEYTFSARECIDEVRKTANSMKPMHLVPTVSEGVKDMPNYAGVMVSSTYVGLANVDTKRYHYTLVLDKFVPLLQNLTQWIIANPSDNDAHVVCVHGCIMCSAYVTTIRFVDTEVYNALWAPLLDRNLTKVMWP